MDADTLLMPERHGGATLGPKAVASGEDVDVVVDPAGDVERFAAGGEGQTYECVRYLQDLRLPKRAVGQIEDKDVLVGVGGNPEALGVVEAVVAAGQDEQRVAIGADYRLYGLADGIVGEILEARIEPGEDRAAGRERCDDLA